MGSPIIFALWEHDHLHKNIASRQHHQEAIQFRAAENALDSNRGSFASRYNALTLGFCTPLEKKLCRDVKKFLSSIESAPPKPRPADTWVILFHA